jgi:hypothetical protein
MWVCTSTFPHVQDVEVDDAVIEGGFCSTVSVEEADTLRREDMEGYVSIDSFTLDKTHSGLSVPHMVRPPFMLRQDTCTCTAYRVYNICVHEP